MKELRKLFRTALSLFLLVASINAYPQDIENRAQVNAWVVAFFDSFNRNLTQGKMDTWMESWAEGAQRKTPMGDADGKAEIRALYEGLIGRYSGLTHSILDTVIEGKRASVELMTVGIHRESGNRVSIPNVALLTFTDSGQVARAHVYLDLKNIENQISTNK